MNDTAESIWAGNEAFFGTDAETYYRDSTGKVHIIQSVDWPTDRGPEPIAALPSGAGHLPDKVLDDEYFDVADAIEGAIADRADTTMTLEELLRFRIDSELDEAKKLVEKMREYQESRDIDGPRMAVAAREEVGVCNHIASMLQGILARAHEEEFGIWLNYATRAN